MRFSKALRGVLGGLTLGGCLLASPVAKANDPATVNTLNLGLGFRYGFNLEDSDLNPWGVGLGAEVGYTLPSALYVGGNFDYFFGETVEILGSELTGNVWQLMGEVGYDVGLGQTWVLRPKMGLGFATLNVEGCTPGLGCTDDSDTEAALAPGVTAIFISPGFSAALDLRYDIVLADPEAVKALIVSVGVGF